MLGTSTHGSGVVGRTSGGLSQSGVSGADFSKTGGGTGVTGTSVHGTGVFGGSSFGSGVQGETGGNGRAGVLGLDQSSRGGFGISGTSTIGTGVEGTATSGIGVRAASANGTALAVAGKVTFSRSGTATIAVGKTGVTFTLAGVTKSSMILSTIQQTAGRIAVSSAVPHSGSFTIHLTAAAASKLKVAYFVIG